MEDLAGSEGFAVSGGFSTTTRVGAKCGRWNPTVEQVKLLTDLFRSGLRTPSTDQIQIISSQLSAFGKIESKNVFYWFQNHKARERHHKKRRRGPQEDQGGVDGGKSSSADQQHQKARSRSILCSLENIGRTKLQGSDQQEEPRGELHHEIIRENMSNISETLELFPLKSYGLEDQEKVMSIGSHEFCKGGGLFEAALDLRLSFW